MRPWLRKKPGIETTELLGALKAVLNVQEAKGADA
jgi:hypothetical protein